MTQQDVVQVFRLVEYIGPRDRVEDLIKKSLHGTKDLGRGLAITAVTLGDFPTILAEAQAKEMAEAEPNTVTIYYSPKEGGDWIPIQVHAVKLPDDSVYDAVNTWRTKS